MGEALDAIAGEIAEYYERGGEDGRLTSGHGLLEYSRTQVLLRRYLPDAPARVLDIGGGTGRYAAWLASEGYEVTLIDPVALHVSQESIEREPSLMGASRHFIAVGRR